MGTKAMQSCANEASAYTSTKECLCKLHLTCKQLISERHIHVAMCSTCTQLTYCKSPYCFTPRRVHKLALKNVCADCT